MGSAYEVRTPAGMEPDAGAVAQIERTLAVDGVERVALMADHHLGYGVPIGGVMASPTHIAPGGVGFDIACGNKAVRTPLPLADLRPELPRIMDEIAASLSFGMGRKNAERVDHPIFESPLWERHPVPGARKLAQEQLGTVGSGNHYVDLLADEGGCVWVACHFGSRGIGHKTATHFLAAIGAKDAIDAVPVLLDVRTPLGQDYLDFMHLAGEYAYAGRDWVVDRVLGILGVRAVDAVHVHHNFAWREAHDGQEMWVVRKGATPLFPGQRGFIGGSMGDVSAIVRGRDTQPPALLGSAPHGAGRVMSRTAAAGKMKRRKVWKCGQRECGQAHEWRNIKQGEPNPRCSACGGKTHKWEQQELVRAGAIDWPAVQESLWSNGVELRGAGADEAPACYKPLAAVLDAHADALEVEAWLRPVGVVMAGADVFDPYKD